MLVVAQLVKNSTLLWKTKLRPQNLVLDEHNRPQRELDSLNE